MTEVVGWVSSLVLLLTITFGTSKAGTPIIGRVPGRRRLYTVLGCGGNGITFSMLAAQLIRALVLGEQDRDAELFSPR